MQGLIPLSFNVSRNQAHVIATVGDQPFFTRQAAQQGRRAHVVADLACGHKEADGTADGICHCLQLGVQSALGAPDQTSALVVGFPFLTRRFEAVRCAFRHVASIIATFPPPPPEASPSMIRAKTPIRLQRIQRL